MSNVSEFSLKTPIALIIFNRPANTARVLEAISIAKPKKLLVVADGPRADRPEDIEKCEAARAIIKQVNWDCQVLTNYSDTNLGCGLRPATGITWVFDTVEEAIILEDDCLPHPTFFPYCEELLDLYREDERVMMIGGVNFLGELISPIQSYHFSRFGSSWGWASWRRAWRHFDYEMKLWPLVRESEILEQMFSDPVHCLYWQEKFQQVYDSNADDIWDYQWLLACWINSGFRVFPETNLVSNIGFGDDATHTFGEGPFSNMQTNGMQFPLKHPPFVFHSAQTDNQIQENFCVMEGWRKPELEGIARRLARKLGLQ
ncbi:MAG: glycosyltransferase family 2 protein [Acidobacteria bacterium]|nr:glycosyltransferase family 2 protein [Acidobacteriota bacterium]